MHFHFILRNELLIRNFGESINRLAEDGHSVSITFSREKKHEASGEIRNSIKSNSLINYVAAPETTHKHGGLSSKIRCMRNYLRYMEPDLFQCQSLKKRAEIRTSSRFVQFCNSVPEALRQVYRKGFDKILSFCDESIPPNPSIIQFLKDSKPDLLIVSPLVDLDSEEIEFIKAARHCGIPSCLWTASWDNLTNKGIIQGKPDSVMVWNDIMKNEAAKFHGIKKSNIYRTGAPLFDWWFTQKPSIDRNEFCKKLNFDPEKKIITYLCSSVAISQNELEPILDWVKIIRLHPDPTVSTANILIRPYPIIKDKILSEMLSKCENMENLSVWPKSGEWVISDKSKQTYFDTIHWSDAVVGVNTSAFIEAGILNTPCLTIVNNAYKKTQDGTMHFKYLTEGKLLLKSENFNDHGEQLKQVLLNPDHNQENSKRFIESFIRPDGIGTAAGDITHNTLISSIPKTIRIPSSRNAIHKAAFFILSKLVSGKDNSSMSSMAEEAMADNYQARKDSKQGRQEQQRQYITEHMSRRADLVNGMVTKALTGKKIILGPWLNDLENEIMHWIPFLGWLCDKHEIRPEDCIAVSCGGKESWYKHLAKQHFNVLSLYSPKEYHYLRQQHLIECRYGSPTGVDRDIINKVKAEFNLKDVEAFYPSSLFEILKPYLENQLDLHYIRKISKVRPLKTPSTGILDKLNLKPGEYSVLKFYNNENYHDNGKSREFIQQLVDKIKSKSTPVILDHDFLIDNKATLTERSIEGAVHLREHCEWENNMQVQSDLIANASSFYGTYGGFSYLAALHGISSINFYNNPSYKIDAKTQDLQISFDGKPPLGNFFLCNTDDWCKLQPDYCHS